MTNNDIEGNEMTNNDRQYIDKVVNDFKSLLTESDGVHVSNYPESRNRVFADPHCRMLLTLLSDDYEWLKREYGVTEDYLAAGWILPDGSALDFRRLDDDRRLLHTCMKMPPRITEHFGSILDSGKLGTDEIMLANGCTRIGNMTEDLTDGRPAYMIQQQVRPTDKQKDSLMALSDADMSRYAGGEISFQAYGQTYEYDSPESFNKFFFNNVLNARYAS